MKKLIILSAIAFSLTTSYAQMGHMDHSKMKDDQADTAKQMKYVCPMHAEVKSNKADKCIKCGMPLVAIKKEYSCPMHKEVRSDKPGKCSKCGMDLIEKKDVSPEKEMKMK